MIYPPFDLSKGIEIKNFWAVYLELKILDLEKKVFFSRKLDH